MKIPAACHGDFAEDLPELFYRTGATFSERISEEKTPEPLVLIIDDRAVLGVRHTTNAATTNAAKFFLLFLQLPPT